jgi:hypothetical protein
MGLSANYGAPVDNQAGITLIRQLGYEYRSIGVGAAGVRARTRSAP